jgi:hypothetical protein
MSKTQNKKQTQGHEKKPVENAPGTGDKKLDGPNRPST